MKKKLALAIAVSVVVTATLTALAARHHYYAEPEEERQAVAGTLNSRILGETRSLLIYLPDGYERDAARRYPVLYVLDGSSHAGHTAESARLLARIGVMPEVIVVGLPHPDGDNRGRDYTPPYMVVDAEAEKPVPGQADRFLAFLETELIPHVDRSYRTTSNRMLAGNSRGGLFVVYSLIEAPELFSARFAFSPALWRDEERIVSKLAAWLKARPAPKTFLYLSLGDRENEKMTRAFRDTTALFRTSELRCRADLTAGGTHQNNAMLSTPVGLHAYFASR